MKGDKEEIFRVSQMEDNVESEEERGGEWMCVVGTGRGEKRIVVSNCNSLLMTVRASMKAWNCAWRA